jgi:hypothetical protein
MEFQQVALTLMAFSSANGGTVEPFHPNGFVLHAPSGASHIHIRRDFLESGAWNVRIEKHSLRGRRSLMPPIYFPPCRTPEELRATVNEAWLLQRKSHPSPFLTRFLDPPNTPPKSASPSRETRLSVRLPPPES